MMNQMMMCMGLGSLLVLLVFMLLTAALVKYLFFDKRNGH